jgi:arsenate reductase
MPNPVLYHNPRCSKSRQAMALLIAKGMPFTIVEYLKTPLS